MRGSSGEPRCKARHREVRAAQTTLPQSAERAGNVPVALLRAHVVVQSRRVRRIMTLAAFLVLPRGPQLCRRLRPRR
jgi:hypothetical protein